MATIVIKDLTENLELDRKAMRAITGGRSGTQLATPLYRSSFFQNPLSFADRNIFPTHHRTGW